MEPGSRDEKNSLAFLDHLAGTGGYQLRPCGYLTLENMRLLESAFVQGKKVWSALPPDAQLDEVHAYLFVQAAPVPQVSRAIRSYRAARQTKERAEAFVDFICDHVEPFLAQLNPEIKAELAEQLAQSDEIEAARVDADPPPGPRNRAEPPNS